MRFPLAPASLLLLAAAPLLANTEGKVRWSADLPAAMKTAAMRKKPVLLEYYFETCIWCNKMGREAFVDAGVVNTIHGKYVPVHVDGKKDDAGRRSAADHGIVGYPTFIILGSDGAEIDRKIGYMKPADMSAWLNAGLRGEGTFAAAEAAYRKDQNNPVFIAAYAGKLNDRQDPAAPALYRRLAAMDPENKAGHREDALAALSQAERYEAGQKGTGTAKEEGYLGELQQIARKPDNIDLAFGRMASIRFRAAKKLKDGDPEKARLLREGLEYQRQLTEKLPADNPGLADSLNDYAYYLFEYGHDVPGATAVAERAVKLERDPNYLDTLASCYAEQGRWADALKLQREAVARDPGNETLKENLASLEKRAAEHGIK